MAVFELRASIEEAGEVEVAALHRQTEPIAVIGAIAPLIGLLGTVLGMIGAFDALGGGAAKQPRVHCREHFTGLDHHPLGTGDRDPMCGIGLLASQPYRCHCRRSRA